MNSSIENDLENELLKLTKADEGVNGDEIIKTDVSIKTDESIKNDENIEADESTKVKSIKCSRRQSRRPRLKSQAAAAAICDYCNKIFCSVHYVKKHIARFHSGKNEKQASVKGEKEEEEEEEERASGSGKQLRNVVGQVDKTDEIEKPKTRYLRCEHCTQIFNSIAYLRKHCAVDHEMYGNEADTIDENQQNKDSEELVLLILNDTQAAITVGGDSVKNRQQQVVQSSSIKSNIVLQNESINSEHDYPKIKISFANNAPPSTSSMGKSGSKMSSCSVRSSLPRSVKMGSERKSNQLEKPRPVKRRKKNERTFFEVKKLGRSGRAPTPKKVDEMKVKSLQCKECARKFTSTFNLKRHLKTHSDANCYKKITKCSICAESMKQADLKSHYKVAHDTDFEEELHIFSSKDEFIEWKESTEANTVAKYVQNQAPRVNKDGSKVTYFSCHRNGFYKPKGKNIRRTKVYGSNKIGSHCPSTIVLKETNTKVTARFYKTHIGHSMDLSRLSLTNKEKEEIAQKIASKVPLEDILNDIRDSLYNEHVRRIHLTTKTDLHNLIVKFKLNKDEIRNDSEYKNVDSWVLTNMAYGSSMIRLYKKQGETFDAFPQLLQQDFCLIVANDAQISLLHKYGNYVVCVDNTHGLDSLGFELFSILVVDELGEGVPCALMFTTRNDTAVLEVFFLAIRTALVGLTLEPRYFMSDLDEGSYLVWLAVFPCSQTQRLLSSWHIDEAWRAQIDKIKTKEPIIKANIYKQAKLLMNEKNLLSFNVMAENFLHELFAKEETRQFASYMQVFVNEPQTWAYAHRMHKGVDASIHLENMHRNLKQIFFKGKKLNRLDRGIQATMRFVKEKMFDRLVATEKGEVSKKLLDIKARHNNAVEISRSMSPYIKQEGPGEWTILSKKSLKELYTVSWRKDDCTCSLRCEACSLCLHSYSCTCPDAAFHWNMCKHIHLIAIDLKEQEAAAKAEAEAQGRMAETEVEVVTNASHVIEMQVEMDDNMAADDMFEMTSEVISASAVVPEQPQPPLALDHQPISIEDQKAEILMLVHSLLDLADSQHKVDTFRKHLLMIEQAYDTVEITANQMQVVSPQDHHSTVINEPVNKKLYVQKLYLRNNSNSNNNHHHNPSNNIT